jgi:transposase
MEAVAQATSTVVQERGVCPHFETLAAGADHEFMMIDAAIVRAHQHSAGAQKKDGDNQAIGRSRGGLTTKIHAVVDALDNPVALSLTPGQAADITQAHLL